MKSASASGASATEQPFCSCQNFWECAFPVAGVRCRAGRRFVDDNEAGLEQPRRSGNSRLVYDKASRTIVSERTQAPVVTPGSLAARLRDLADGDNQLQRTVLREAADELDRLAVQQHGLFHAIAHGDETHRAWLKQAIDDWFAGRLVERPQPPTPPARDHKDVVEAARKIEARMPRVEEALRCAGSKVLAEHMRGLAVALQIALLRYDGRA